MMMEKRPACETQLHEQTITWKWGDTEHKSTNQNGPMWLQHGPQDHKEESWKT